MTASLNYIKCKDTDKNPIKPCVFALLPDDFFGEQMSDYIKCELNNTHYNKNKDRQCKYYRGGKLG